MRRRIRKGLAMLLTAAMVVGLMPGVGTMKVSAEESEASAEGYDADGFCMSYELTNGTWALKSDATECATHGDTCNGYQPAAEEQLEYDISGDGTTDGNDKAYKITNAGQLYWFADKVNNKNATYNNINAVLTNDITVNEGVLSDGALNTANESTFRSWTPIGYYDSDTKKDYFYSGIFDGQGYTISGLYFNASKSEVGLFGESNGTIKRINITDSYIGGGGFNVGGICGVNMGTIEDSNNINSFVINSDQRTGGICGYNEGTITSCENTGNVSGSSRVGGVCGIFESGFIKNCSNTGNVSGSSDCVGGVCGYFNYGSLENSYNIGEVKGSSSVGGVCGCNYISTSSIKNCYYIKEESSTIDAIGTRREAPCEIYVEGKTSEQFSSGVVAYLLNSRAAEGSPVWYQNIDNVATPDTAPVLDSSHGTVYASKPCPAKCSNTENEVLTESQAHVFGGDNTCTVCGAKGEIIDDSTLINDKPKQDDAGVYQLETERQFYYFVALVNGRLAGVPQDTSASAVLKTDITVNDKVLDEDGNLVSETSNLKTWVPIGYSDGVRVQTYTGTFDGGGHTISGLYFDDTSISYVGLFGNSTGTIKNVKVADSYFKSNTYVGGVCGKNEGNIEGCEASGKVEANNIYADIGGICGYNGTGYVKNCKSAVDISHPIYFTHPNGGGIVGQNDGIIENCHNIGDVDLSRTTYSTAGGICGKNNTGGTIKNSYNIGIIIGDDFTGKICGINNGSVTNCYYQDSSESDSIAGTTFKTAPQFASGEVAYLLNEGKSDSGVVWRQTLDTDATPVLDSGHGIVYASHPCESDFANTKFAEEKKHTVTMSEDGTSHTCSVCNKTEKHADVATFTVNKTNHSITAICPSCGDLGTITVSASDATYDGTEKAASTSGEIKGFTPTIVYEKQADNESFETITSTPKDAGTYRASITYTVDADNSKVYTVSTEYTIARRPVTITANDASKTYEETDPALSFTVSEETPLVDGEALSGELSRLTGENAGTYTITQGTVTNDNNPNYDITFNEGTFTINKAQTWETADCVMNLVYDESSQSYIATIKKVDNAEYRFDGFEWSNENICNGISPHNSVTGYIRIAGDKNHEPGIVTSVKKTAGHGLLHVAAKAADCENDGNIEYWHCVDCDNNYSDSEGTDDVYDVVISKLEHKWSSDYAYDETSHWYNCENANCPVTENSKKKGFGYHSDSDNNGICDVCDYRIEYIIAVSILDDNGSTIEANVEGLKNHSPGEGVKLTVPVIPGYNFVGWYNKGSQTGNPICKSRTYEFQAEADRDLVAVYKPIGSAELTIDGGKDFTINDDNKTTAITATYPMGSQITVVCNDSDFGYWKNSAGMVVSRDKSYTFTVTGKETISAVFNTIAENKATVVFESYYGQVIARDQYAKGATLAETPGLPFRYGYTALGWDYNGDGKFNAEEDTFAKALERGFTSEDKLVKILPVYQLIGNTYQITVENGTGAGTYNQNDVVTVVANEPSANQKFSHWKDGDGNILSYNEKYQFYAAKDITVKAVYVADTAKVEAKGTTVVIDKYADKTNGKLTFVSMSTVPEGCTINMAGVIATNVESVGTSEDGFNADTAVYVRGSAWTGNEVRYTWTKGKVESGVTWYVRAYLVYTDVDGNVNTVYGDMVSQTME